MVKSFEGLTKSQISTLKRRESLLLKVKDSNKSIHQLLSMDKRQWNKALGTEVEKKASLDAQKRLLRQINDNIQKVSDYHIEVRKIKNPDIQEATKKVIHRLLRKEGQYSIVEVRYKDESKWIKYTSNRKYNWHLNKLREAYGSNYELIFYNFKMRPEFLLQQFKKTVAITGIKV